MSNDLVLYRFFDADGALLYVGKSINVWRRLGAHRRGSEFYPEAASVTLQRGFGSESELAAAEAAAIRAERPRYNYETFSGDLTPATEEPAAALRMGRPAKGVTRIGKTPALTIRMPKPIRDELAYRVAIGESASEAEIIRRALIEYFEYHPRDLQVDGTPA
jgi:Nuclease subunit of the excinuclease complex